MIKCKAENKIEEVKKLHSQGFGNRKISKQLNIPRSSLKYLCDKYGLLPQVKQIKNVNLTTYEPISKNEIERENGTLPGQLENTNETSF